MNAVANLQIKHQDTDTHLTFDFLDEHTVEVLANFYTLEGAALSANTYFADIKESNYELLHLSISTEPKLLNKDISLNEGDVLLNLAIAIPGDEKIYQISQAVNKDPIVLNILNDSETLSLERNDSQFMKLYQTEMWWVPLLSDTANIQQNGYQEVPNDSIAPNSDGTPQFGIMSAPTIIGDSSFPISPYINPISFTTTGVYKLEVNDVGGNLVRGYIRESYEQPNGTIITLAALYNFSNSVAVPPGGSSTQRVAYTAGQRAHNIFGLYDPSTNTVTISYAPNNSIYVFTREPRISMKITGSGTGGYFEQYRFGQHNGGSSGNPWQSIQTTLLGLRYPQLGWPLAVY